MLDPPMPTQYDKARCCDACKGWPALQTHFPWQCSLLDMLGALAICVAGYIRANSLKPACGSQAVQTERAASGARA